METFKRPSIPPLPGIRSITSLQRRISIDRSSTTQRSSRVSSVSARTESPGSGRGSLGPDQSLLRPSPLSTGRRDVAEEMMRQHMQIGNKVAFRAMSGAAKVTRSRLLEDKCERALQAMRTKELRDSRLPLSLVTENSVSSAFPCPLRSVLSLRGKADMRLRAKRDYKADLMRLFHERKN